MKIKRPTDLDKIARLRWQEKSCSNCRYFRIHTTGAVVSECLLLGRTLGIHTKLNSHTLWGWGRERLCDGWKRRPKTWNVYSEGTGSNPHWYDPYIPRETQIRLAHKLKRKQNESDPMV